MDRRHPVVSRQRSELKAAVDEQWAGTYQQRINRLLGKPRKGRINVTAGGGLDDFDLLSDGQRRSLNGPRQRTEWGRSWDRPARQRARLPAATHATTQVALPQAQQ